MKKASSFVTDTVEVKWSHLHKPDIKFGADAANHNITIVVDDKLEKKLEEVSQELGCSKINGMKQEEDGSKTLKAKTKIYVRKDVSMFPCVDANAKETTVIPFNGDKVRLRLAPICIDRDMSLSLFLNGVQIIEKNATEDNGFTPTEGGYVAAQSTSQQEVIEEQEEDDLPF